MEVVSESCHVFVISGRNRLDLVRGRAIPYLIFKEETLSMQDTTDFEVWIEDNEPDGYEEIYTLYRSVAEREDNGIWAVTTNGDKTFVTGPTSTLQLLSEKARRTFLNAVEALKSDPEMDMESWYGYERNMANSKA